MATKNDPLVNRDCVILDGHCDCPPNPNGGIPFCRKYGTIKALEAKHVIQSRSKDQAKDTH